MYTLFDTRVTYERMTDGVLPQEPRRPTHFLIYFLFLSLVPSYFTLHVKNQDN
jgi:hypothetical protein